MAQLRFKRDRAYHQIQPIVNAIMMDVYDVTPARLAIFFPRRFPILIITASESDCPTHQKKKANRTDVAMPKENGAWKVVDAEARSMD